MASKTPSKLSFKMSSVLLEPDLLAASTNVHILYLSLSHMCFRCLMQLITHCSARCPVKTTRPGLVESLLRQTKSSSGLKMAAVTSTSCLPGKPSSEFLRLTLETETLKQGSQTPGLQLNVKNRMQFGPLCYSFIHQLTAA